jgi:hypothetical protein
MRRERRQDHALRALVTKYRSLSDEAAEEAARMPDKALRDRYLALSEAWDSIADALQGRTTEPKSK